MGQKVNPHGLRVGVIKDWDSRWYAEADFADYDDHPAWKATLWSATIFTHLNSALTATADRAVFARHQYRPDVTKNGNGRQRRPGYSDQKVPADITTVAPDLHDGSLRLTELAPATVAERLVLPRPSA